jgi:hypothetical protein
MVLVEVDSEQIPAFVDEWINYSKYEFYGFLRDVAVWCRKVLNGISQTPKGTECFWIGEPNARSSP